MYAFPQVQAEKTALEVDRGSFLAQVESVRQELLAVSKQSQEREAAAIQAEHEAQLTLQHAERTASEAATQRCAPVCVLFCLWLSQRGGNAAVRICVCSVSDAAQPVKLQSNSADMHGDTLLMLWP